MGDEEFATYLSCASDLLTQVALTLKETGMRPDECHRLRWENLNWSSGRDGTLLIEEGKSPAARRLIPLTPRVRMILETRWRETGVPREGFIWSATNKSGHINHSTLKKQHAQAVKRSGVRPFVLYSLRHTFATRIAPHVDAASRHLKM